MMWPALGTIAINSFRLLQSGSAGNYLRYKYLDTYFRYFKSILYLDTFSDMYLVSVSKIQIKSILYSFIYRH